MSEDAETNPLRRWRGTRSLEEICNLFPLHGFPRPSIAKLSRIERDQKVPPQDVPAVAAITGIPARELRPDLAKMFGAA
ncbi:hypothetical protein [Bradyrhizobium centrolobii]|uniref:hypothetical protein n=1 Tax=Bradyrhizobium centrolobii TaxID=1505087 RepID=UPI0010A96882|nr:hypothetical protein [Bradyrhizobium centrolobii]